MADRIELKRLTMNPHLLEDVGEQAATPLLDDLGEQTRAEARRLAPVETGALRDSIVSAVEGHGTEVAAIVAANIEYAHFVEFGTGRQAPQPFLRRALMAVWRRLR
jgi:HK97 gp10 family phage protein